MSGETHWVWRFTVVGAQSDGTAAAAQMETSSHAYEHFSARREIERQARERFAIRFPSAEIATEWWDAEELQLAEDD